MTDKIRKRAISLALRLLTGRMRSAYEVKKYLLSKGFVPEVCDHAIHVLEEYGYIDDSEYAYCWVRNRLSKRGFFRLRRDLRSKGICRHLIDQVLNEFGFAEEYSSAVVLMEKEQCRKQSSYHPHKLLASLERRGYSYEVINKLRREVLDHQLRDYFEIIHSRAGKP